MDRIEPSFNSADVAPRTQVVARVRPREHDRPGDHE